MSSRRLQLTFNCDSYNPLLDCFPINPTISSDFAPVLLHDFEFDKYEYFAEADEVKGFKHELWQEGENEYTFMLSGKAGNKAKSLILPDSRLVWDCYATSHFEAMEKYYQYMDWGHYSSEFLDDRIPYESKSIRLLNKKHDFHKRSAY